MVVAGGDNQHCRMTLQVTQINIYGTPWFELVVSGTTQNMLCKDLTNKFFLLQKKTLKNITVGTEVKSQVVGIPHEVPVSFGNMLFRWVFWS